MLQGGGAYPGARAEEMLRLVAAYSADPIDPEFLLDALGLTDVRRTSYRRLSGGQQQRVACARAIVSRPEIIFGDEPTGNLDSNSSREVLTILRDAVDDIGQTVVIVTHDATAASYADRVVFLADGRVVDELRNPTPADILARMADIENL